MSTLLAVLDGPPVVNTMLLNPHPRLLHPRLEKVCAMLTTPSHDGHDPLRFRPGTAPSPVRAPGTPQQQNANTSPSGGNASGEPSRELAAPCNRNAG